MQRYAVSLAIATRQPARAGLGDLARHIAFGASPRGPIGLVHAGRALALVRGRRYVLPQDMASSPPTSCATASSSPTRRWPRASSPT